MLIALIGENCAGKSTLAEAIRLKRGGEIISGKDYLRLAKSESIAQALFKKKLKEAVTGDDLIYVITEKDHLSLLPDGAVRVLVTAELDTIKERFKARMHGVLPPPVEKMLEMKHGCFDSGEYDHRFKSGEDDIEAFCERLKDR